MRGNKQANCETAPDQTAVADTNKKDKHITFNLCSYDELDLRFVNREGVNVYWIYFLRMCTEGQGRKVQKENPEAHEHISFRRREHDQSVAIFAAEFNFEFKAKHAPRKSTSTDASSHKRIIKLAEFGYRRELYVHIKGKNGLDLGTFNFINADEQTQVSILHADGSGHALTFFPPEKESKQEVKVNG